MKGALIKGALVFTLLFILSNYAIATSNDPCNLDAELINQDPYPSLPGEYVEVLFQLTGVGGCDEGVTAALVLDYPFSIEGDGIRRIFSDTYAGQGVNSNWNLLYKIRVDRNAIEDDYEVELRYAQGRVLDDSAYSYTKFNITVEDGRTDFEIHVEDYKISTRNLVLEILNVGNQDIEALTIEIPKQENIIVRGSNKNIVGDLDSNEYTTADFEAIPQEGEMKINLFYTDSTNERRTIEKTVYYDPSYFIDSLDNAKQDRTAIYIITGLVILLIALFFFRKYKKKNKKKKRKFKI